MTDALQVPLVKRAFDLLGAQFVRIDEGFATVPTNADGRFESHESKET
jgi:hypothetical protein